MMKVFQDLDVDGSVEGTSFIKTGGTSSQFLKADGSIDSTTYAGAYVHPSYATTNINTSTSTIIDAITTNSTGHITAMSTRVLTLANLGYTGATNANNYVLPFTDNSSNWNTAHGWGDHSTEGYISSVSGNWTGTFDGQEGTYYLDYNNFTNTPTIPGAYVHPDYVTTNINTSGSTIIDSITTNATGHITAMGTRVLTLANLGYTGATDANNYVLPTNLAGDDFSIDTTALSGATVISDLDVNISTDASGRVTDANGTVATRELTLGDLGFTGATNANNYVHPTYNGDDFSIDTTALTGAVVISDLDINITTDTSGHVTDANATVGTRTLTLANLGYTGATDANNYVLPSAGIGAGTYGTVGDSSKIDEITVDAQGRVTAISTGNTGNVTPTNGATFTNKQGSNSQWTNDENYITAAGNTQRSDEEIRDVAAAQWIDGTNTTVVVDDAANTIKINATGGSSGIDGSGTAKFIPRFSDSDTLTDSSIYEDNDGNILINSSTIGDGALNVYQTTTDPSLHIVTNDAGASAGPIIKMERDSSTPADDDLLGKIEFVGKDSNGGDTTYGQLQGYIYDTTVGSSLRGGFKLQSFQSSTMHTSLETVGSRGYLHNSWYVNDDLVITGTGTLGIETGATIELNNSSGQAGKVLTSQGASSPTWEPMVSSDVSEGGTGSVLISNMVKITAAAHTSLGAGADADTLYIIVG